MTGQWFRRYVEKERCLRAATRSVRRRRLLRSNRFIGKVTTALKRAGQISDLRYKKGRPSSGPLREDSLEQPFNVGALNTEGGVQ